MLIDRFAQRIDVFFVERRLIDDYITIFDEKDVLDVCLLKTAALDRRGELCVFDFMVPSFTRLF